MPVDTKLEMIPDVGWGSRRGEMLPRVTSHPPPWRHGLAGTEAWSLFSAPPLEGTKAVYPGAEGLRELWGGHLQCPGPQ